MLFLFAARPPGCDKDDDCPDNKSCENRRCINPCEVKPCGINAYCNATDHTAICQCPPNYYGNPNIMCSKCKWSSSLFVDYSCMNFLFFLTPRRKNGITYQRIRATYTCVCQGLPNRLLNSSILGIPLPELLNRCCIRVALTTLFTYSRNPHPVNLQALSQEPVLATPIGISIKLS